MTDLLTKEERQTVERARLKIREDEAFDNLHTLESELLAIIDNLSKRGVKKYSKTEILQEWSVRSRPEGGFSTVWETNASRDAFLACARFLGALEEE